MPDFRAKVTGMDLTVDYPDNEDRSVLLDAVQSLGDAIDIETRLAAALNDRTSGRPWIVSATPDQTRPHESGNAFVIESLLITVAREDS